MPDYDTRSEEGVRYEDATPTPEGYRQMLLFICANSTKEEDKVWAFHEYHRVKDVVRWTRDKDDPFEDGDTEEGMTYETAMQTQMAELIIHPVDPRPYDPEDGYYHLHHKDGSHG